LTYGAFIHVPHDRITVKARSSSNNPVLSAVICAAKLSTAALLPRTWIEM
jgi:hypothetical protein